MRSGKDDGKNMVNLALPTILSNPIHDIKKLAMSKSLQYSMIYQYYVITSMSYSMEKSPCKLT